MHVPAGRPAGTKGGMLPSNRQLGCASDRLKTRVDLPLSLSLHRVHLGLSQQDTSYARDGAPNLRRALHHSARCDLLLSSNFVLISSHLYTRSAAKLHRGLYLGPTRSPALRLSSSIASRNWRFLRLAFYNPSRESEELVAKRSHSSKLIRAPSCRLNFAALPTGPPVLW